jgi:hypothetical protein
MLLDGRKNLARTRENTFNEIMYLLLKSTFWCRKVTSSLSRPQKSATDVAQSDRHDL